MTPPTTLHGSYVASDVTFLLRLTKLESTDLAEKERLIQSGQRHYSQMLSIESPPSNEHQTLYQQALNTGLERLATEVQMLALALKAKRPQRPIVLVSFVRAGIPLAIILRRALLDLGVECVHYGVSIIRDKGIDTAALNWIETQHNFEDIVFVDGWVGKGAIFTQLQASLGQRYTDEIPFVVLADPTGKAWLSASGDDWLIPSGVLGATVSGLISRSVLPDDGGWHYCMLYEHLREYDQSQAFIETVDAHRKTLKTVPLLNWTPTLRAQLQAQSQAAIAHLVDTYQIQNLNRLKPGIAEATRAILRRMPERILVQNPTNPNLNLLRHLAQTRQIELQTVANLGPYHAITIIKKAL